MMLAHLLNAMSVRILAWKVTIFLCWWGSLETTNISILLKLLYLNFSIHRWISPAAIVTSRSNGNFLFLEFLLCLLSEILLYGRVVSSVVEGLQLWSYTALISKPRAAA